MIKLILTLLCAAVVLVAAPIRRVTLIDAGNPLVWDGSYDVGPYTLEIDGSKVPVLCVDLQDESAVGEQWDAYTTPLGGDLSGTYHSGGLYQYEEEAYLYTLITQPGADRIGLQHAAWAITDGTFSPDQISQSWIYEAQQNAGTVDLSRFEVISAVVGIQGARPQEFLTEVVPEASLVNLVVGLFAVGLALLGRKRG